MNDDTDISLNGEEAELSLIQRLVGIVTSPGRTISYIKVKPDWIFPLLITITVFVSAQMVIKPYFFNSSEYEKTVTDVMERANIDRKTAEQMMQKNMTIFMPVGVIIMTPIVLLLFSGAMFLGGNLLMGGETSFKHLYSMNAYIGIIGAVGMLLKVPLIMAKGSTDILTNLAILMPPEAKESILYKLLSLFDVIIIWESIIAAIGLVILYNWTQKQANTLIIGIWVVVITVYGLILLIF